MDRAYIQSHGIALRYLSGALPDAEARSFEKACLADPSLLDDFQVDFRLKSGFERLAELGELAPPTAARAAGRTNRGFALAASVVAAAGFAAAVVLGVQGHRQRQVIADLQVAVAARSSPLILADTVRLLTTRGDRIDVALPEQGALGLSVDATGLEDTQARVELRRDGGNVVLRSTHRVPADGTIFLVLERGQVEPGDYTLELAPQAAEAPPAGLVYRIRFR